jgi:CubicO group peptidase (beta-lactamase class C family)
MLTAANWTVRLRELAVRARVPGAALGIWCDEQEVLAAYGVLNCATQVPVTADSVFQVGSITKVCQLPDGTPYLYLSGRVTPRVG